MITQLKLDLNTVRSLLVGFIKTEIGKIGFQKVVLGLSGGVDSALVAYLAVEALSAENVLSVLMPYKSSNRQSLLDAEKVVSILQTKREIVDITPMVDPMIATNSEMSAIRKGNIMARVRMIVLYDRSARDNALVLGTGNKTETLLGYSTLYGDSACAINPIGDLYKSQIWKLASHLRIPQEIIDKKPSADLWIGQTDESELGFSYKLVDELLYFMVDERRSKEELIESGFEENFILKVQRLIQRNQFKRMAPIVAKIGYRTTNVDFRYARDWGV